MVFQQEIHVDRNIVVIGLTKLSTEGDLFLKNWKVCPSLVIISRHGISFHSLAFQRWPVDFPKNARVIIVTS